MFYAGSLKKIIIGVVLVLVVGLGVMVLWYGQDISEEEAVARFITANPLDLSQISGFSQYRSCEGHDFRFLTLTGVMESTPRSMKHYISAKPEYRGTDDQVRAFAPFDGVISSIEDRVSSTDQQVWLTPDEGSPRQWHFIFFHLNLRDDLEEGSPVSAGELIGAANLKRGPDGATDNFDMAVKFTKPLSRPMVSPPLNHMTQEVLAEYAAYGVTPDNMVIAAEERTADPCPVDPADGDDQEAFFPPDAAVDEYIDLEAP